MTASSGDPSIALKQWLVENNVMSYDPTDPADAVYRPNTPEPSGATGTGKASGSTVAGDTPWRTDPHYFTHVRISAIALIKIIMHARAGSPLEVMGLMQGKVLGRCMVVLDAFALPVQGTETRVNAQQEAFEYMVQYQSAAAEAGRVEHILGWYHSHPGYGCWLSGIDVSTQLTNQQYQEPFLAIVVDPNRTISAGRVDIGAFRTYPANYTPPNTAPSEYQSIPLSKIEDFGVHANQYYALEVSIFKSRLDTHLLELLWNKHWISTLSHSPLTTNKEYLIGQLADVAAKLDRADSQVAKPRILGTSITTGTTNTSPTASSNVDTGLIHKEQDSTRSQPPPPPPPSSSSSISIMTTQFGAVDDTKTLESPVTTPSSSTKMMDLPGTEGSGTTKQQADTHLGKAARDASKVVAEVTQSLLSQVLKHVVFNMTSANRIGPQSPPPGSPSLIMDMDTTD